MGMSVPIPVEIDRLKRSPPASNTVRAWVLALERASEVVDCFELHGIECLVIKMRPSYSGAVSIDYVAMCFNDLLGVWHCAGASSEEGEPTWSGWLHGTPIQARDSAVRLARFLAKKM